MPKDEKELISETHDAVIRIEAHFLDLKERVKKVEDNQTWLWRSFGGSIFATFLSFIFHGKG